jgi:hypothetical protein
VQTSSFVAVAFALIGVVAGVSGCGDDQDPGGASALWSRIHNEKYGSWTRAPGYETRRTSGAPHGGAVDIFVNDVGATALASTTSITAWPEGTVIVKDGYDGSTRTIVAAMEKRKDGWFWAEWDGSGDSKYSGKPSTCVDCHARGADYVRAFPLPK